MSARKPVLRVWCLPAMPEEALVNLHADLVAAAVSIKELELKGEQDLIVLFPADLMQHGLGSEILVEYDDIADYWKRDERAQLAAKLGNVAKKRFPAAFIQCEVRSGDGKARSHWTSKQSTNRKEVKRIHAAAAKLLPKFQHAAANECYCRANAMDHKGPCGHHCELASYEYVVQEGARILSMGEAEFQASADVYVERCRNDTYEELHYELGWAQRPAKKA